jgi:hypothetical protein
MRPYRLRSLRLLAGALLLLSGCSLTPDGDPLRPRLFSPEGPPEAFRKQTATEGPELRLGWVRSAEHLGRRIAIRQGAVIGFYELRRWAESPVVYLERTLRRHLFHGDDGVRRSLAAETPGLDVSLVAFEEVRPPEDEDGEERPEARVARVALRYVLLRGEEHVAEGLVRAEAPIGTQEELEELADPAPRMAQAMGSALDAAVLDLAAAVREHLGG